jgi:hypothetical protein
MFHLITIAVNTDYTEEYFDADGELVAAVGTCFVVIGRDADAAVSEGVVVAEVQGFEVIAPAAEEQDLLARQLQLIAEAWVEVRRLAAVGSLPESKHMY